MADYGSALGSMEGAQGLRDLLNPALFEPVPGGSCFVSRKMDSSSMGVKIAAHLLTDPNQPARFVQMMDVGLSDGVDDLEGYDVHENHVRLGATSMIHSCQALADAINKPGEGDPRKLDLDKHLIAITTEFGRSPTAQGGNLSGNGTGHWPMGFPVVLIGGPIQSPGVVGAINEQGMATDWVTPGELRAGMLLAQGIWPFTPEAFRVGDMQSVSNEVEAAVRVGQRIPGYTA